jgi:hypothetical protein
VESSCELGNEPSGSIKCWELLSGCTSCGLSSGTQLHRDSLVSYYGEKVFLCIDIKKILSDIVLSHPVKNTLFINNARNVMFFPLDHYTYSLLFSFVSNTFRAFMLPTATSFQS